MNKKDLSKYDNSWYTPGRNALIRALWYITNALFFKKSWCTPYGIKRALLRCYGAHIGKNVVIKPCVNIKYPWRLEIGDNSWIGEGVWIDNIAEVTIGKNCCISQGALLICGNHDYTKETFDLQIGDITIEDSAWIGAKAIVCPGIKMGEASVLTAGSVATKDLSPNTIYQGNPATEKKKL